MKSKVDLFKEHLGLILTTVFLVKLIFTGLSPADCLGALVLLLSIQVSKVVDYLFPKRPDLYKDISVINETVQNLITKQEELDRDVTGLKFFAARK